jgi:chromatin assembly factor 1 subunit B
MRVRTLEIRWHDSKPISTCDFQPVFFKKARPAHDRAFAGQSYRLATGGEDNHVRVGISLLAPSETVGPNLVKDLDGLSEHRSSVPRRSRV